MRLYFSICKKVECRVKLTCILYRLFRAENFLECGKHMKLKLEKLIGKCSGLLLLQLKPSICIYKLTHAIFVLKIYYVLTQIKIKVKLEESYFHWNDNGLTNMYLV